MSRVILITGGARSGKSILAESLAKEEGAPLAYIATGAPGDAEMAERIRLHRERRGAEWETIEEPLRLREAILGCDGRYPALLVDCVTLWLTNLLFLYESREDVSAEVLREVEELVSAFPSLRSRLILVTNEVGMGIVPENRLAREFRDLAGKANQILAAAADEVHVTISGIPLKLK